MRTRTHSRSILLAGKMAKRGTSFTSGLLLGLSAASLLLAGNLPEPKAPKEGLNSDWNAVGQDLKDALDGYGS